MQNILAGGGFLSSPVGGPLLLADGAQILINPRALEPAQVFQRLLPVGGLPGFAANGATFTFPQSGS